MPLGCGGTRPLDRIEMITKVHGISDLWGWPRRRLAAVPLALGGPLTLPCSSEWALARSLTAGPDAPRSEA